jgi:hypothetical protein
MKSGHPSPSLSFLTTVSGSITSLLGLLVGLTDFRGVGDTVIVFVADGLTVGEAVGEADGEGVSDAIGDASSGSEDCVGSKRVGLGLGDAVGVSTDIDSL